MQKTAWCNYPHVSTACPCPPAQAEDPPVQGGSLWDELAEAAPAPEFTSHVSFPTFPPYSGSVDFVFSFKYAIRSQPSEVQQ